MATRKKTKVKRKASVKKKSAKKSVKKTAKKAKPETVKKSVRKPARQTSKSKHGPNTRNPVGDVKEFRDLLFTQRARLSGQVAVLKSESLTRSDSVVSGEDGTDAFERQFALDVVSSEYDLLFEIDEALRRIDDGTYGVCGECKKRIKKTRLKALPFVKMCIHCQSEIEKGKVRFSPTSAARRV